MLNNAIPPPSTPSSHVCGYNSIGFQEVSLNFSQSQYGFRAVEHLALHAAPPSRGVAGSYRQRAALEAGGGQAHRVRRLLAEPLDVLHLGDDQRHELAQTRVLL